MMFSYTAPFGGNIKIIPSREMTDEECFEVGLHEKIKDLVYLIQFNGESCPWTADTQAQANALAMGMQWGAYKMLEREKKND
jgi:hypothetical protein